IDTIKIIWNIRECKRKITLLNHGQKLKGRGKNYYCRVRETSRIRNYWLSCWETEPGNNRHSTWQERFWHWAKTTLESWVRNLYACSCASNVSGKQRLSAWLQLLS